MKSNRVPFYGGVILACVGVLLTFSPLFHLLNNGSSGIHFHFNHHIIQFTSVVSLPVVGIMLIYLSIFVYHRRLLAVYVSGGLSLLMLFYLLFVYAWGFIMGLVSILIVIYFVIVCRYRREFIVENNLEGLSQHLRQIGIMALVGLFYGIITFFLFGPRLFHAHFSIIDSFGMTFNGLTGFNGTISRSTHLGQLFINSLGGMGVVIFILLLGAFFRPLRLKVWNNSHDDRLKAERIVAASSHSSEDFFKLWPVDKQYYFSPTSKAFLAYKQSGHTIVILGGPVGESSAYDTLVHDFIEYCYSLGWRVAAISVNPQEKLLYEEHGLSTLFIGNEGIIDITHFMQKTWGDKHFRYVRNKAKREGLEVVEWTAPSHEQLRQLEAISNAWLSHGGRREYTFFMGYFNRWYLEQCRIYVLVEQGKPVAYINLIPSYYDNHDSLDHFRSYPAISSVGMHFLLMKVLQTLSTKKVKMLNIGLSPLSGIKKETGNFSHILLRLVRLLGANYYSFKGLEQFKNKFRPQWDQRFLLYSGTSAGLLRITKDIEYASSYSLRGNRQVYVSILGGIIVLTLGLYFILG